MVVLGGVDLPGRNVWVQLVWLVWLVELQDSFLVGVDDDIISVFQSSPS